MGLDGDLKQFLSDFGRLESDQRRATAELASLREELRGREEQAKAAEAEVARLRRELAQRRPRGTSWRGSRSWWGRSPSTRGR